MMMRLKFHHHRHYHHHQHHWDLTLTFSPINCVTGVFTIAGDPGWSTYEPNAGDMEKNEKELKTEPFRMSMEALGRQGKPWGE